MVEKAGIENLFTANDVRQIAFTLTEYSHSLSLKSASRGGF
jgi:hypothetical protein